MRFRIHLDAAEGAGRLLSSPSRVRSFMGFYELLLALGQQRFNLVVLATPFG